MILGAIDPGLSGALAVLDEPAVVAVYDLPTMGLGKQRVLNGGELARMLCEARVDRVIIEHAQSMPGQGLGSTFRFGTSFGQVIGVVQSLGIPHEFVTASKWKREMALTGKDKEMSRRRAIERFPTLTSGLERVKDHNRAEAILLAVWWTERHES